MDIVVVTGNPVPTLPLDLDVLERSNTHEVPELAVKDEGQWFCEVVRRHIGRRNVCDRHFAIFDEFTDEVITNIYVLGPTIMGRIVGDENPRLIVGE